MRLTLSFLGACEVVHEGRPLVFATNSARALFAYLAVESHKSHPRAQLAELLWPEQAPQASFAALRTSLARVRKAIPAPPGADAVLDAGRFALRLHPESITSDVAAFEALLDACAQHARAEPRTHGTPLTCPNCAARLEQAIALYRGDFLDGLSMEHSQPFEEWILFRREQLRRQALAAMDALARHFEAAGNFERMGDLAARQLAIEPWREDAHAQRMRALAAQGQRAAALAQYQASARILAQELGIEPSIELRSLYERIQAGESASAAAAAAPRHNLQAQLTPFIGREAELAEITSWLRDRGVRLLTLIGPGGAGKSRLALEAARAHLDDFADGVWWVPLSGAVPAHEPGLQRAAIVNAIAKAVAIPLHGRRPPLEELTEALRERSALLVLDSCEHLTEAASVANTLLAGAPQLHVLATSRERLWLNGEALLRLEGLPVAAGGLDPAGSPGVRMFLERAARHAPQWTPDAGATAGVIRLCQVLDGLPLAIELAAHWVGHFTPDEIAAAVRDDLGFLDAQARDLPDRHRSLRAAFDYAWRLLKPNEQQALARLSTFRGAFDRAAAQAVTEVRMTTLATLVDKSLLRQAGVGQYSLHELLRQFAAERLAASGDGAAVEARHAAHFLALADATVPDLAKPDHGPAFERMERALDNLRAALEWALRHSAAETGLRVVAGLMSFWEFRGYISEGRDWLERFALATESEHVPTKVQARAAEAAGKLANIQGDHSAGERWLSEANGLYRDAGDLTGAVRTLNTLGGVAYDQGHLAQALALWEQCLAQARVAGDLHEVIRALGNLGECCFRAGDLDRATELQEESLALARQSGNRYFEAIQLGNLGNVARARGDLSRAAEFQRQALTLKHALRNQRQIAVTLEDIASLAVAEGRAERAATLFGAAAAIRGSIGTPRADPERRTAEDTVALARRTLGDAAWSAAFAVGAALTQDQVVAFGLAGL